MKKDVYGAEYCDMMRYFADLDLSSGADDRMRGERS